MSRKALLNQAVSQFATNLQYCIPKRYRTKDNFEYLVYSEKIYFKGSIHFSSYFDYKDFGYFHGSHARLSTATNLTIGNIVFYKDELSKIDDLERVNSEKVLNAFIKMQVAETDFNATTGYGYNDIGRDVIEKIYANIRLILCTFDERMPAYPGMLLLLLYIRMIDVDFYRAINRREVSVQEIVSFIERSFPEQLVAPQSSPQRKIDLRQFLFEVAKLLICYSMDRETGDMSWELLSEKGEFVCETKMDKKALEDAVNYYGERDVLRNSLFRNLSLLIEHIELALPLLNTDDAM